MLPPASYKLFQELQSYVGWTDADAARVRAVGVLLQPSFADLVEDFYEEIHRHGNARRVITGGQEQIDRLKGTLRDWLEQLFVGTYDETYVSRRRQVGYRHVEIGLDQVTRMWPSRACGAA